MVFPQDYIVDKNAFLKKIAECDQFTKGSKLRNYIENIERKISATNK